MSIMSRIKIKKMKNHFEANVSWFKNYNSPTPSGVVGLGKILFGDRNRATIERIRTIEDKGQRDALKATLPAFTPSCTCTYRSQNKVVEHSGLIQFDIDAKENPSLSMQGFKAELSNVPTILYCGLSVSGKGLWGLIPIAYPDMHKQHFEHIKRWFSGYGVTIDSAPSSVVSLRGISYDSSPHVNPMAEVLERYHIEPIKQHRTMFNADGSTPAWEQYNATTDFETVLFNHGWKTAQQKGHKTRYTRPSKSGGISAEFDADKRVFYVFTSSTQFDAGKGYSPFAVLAILEHGGNYRDASKALNQINILH